MEARLRARDVPARGGSEAPRTIGAPGRPAGLHPVPSDLPSTPLQPESLLSPIAPDRRGGVMIHDHGHKHDDGPDHGERFTIGTDFSAEQAMIYVRGRLDMVAASPLGALLDTAIDAGYPSVIIDADGLESVTPECLTVMVDAADLLAGLDRRFAIRSPSVRVQRLLDVRGLTDLVFVDEDGTTVTRPPVESMGALDPPIRIGTDRQIPDIRPAAEFPSEDDLVDGALRMVVALAQATVPAADGVSVSLRRNGNLSTVAASDQTILDMDTYQYSTGEGPCVDASIEGRRFQTQSLVNEERWPAFSPKAHSLGINAILSSPLRVDKVPVGALNIYSRRPSVFAAEDQRLAAVFANEASIILTEARIDVSAEVRAARFQAALTTRQVIAQAQGVLMEREGISEDQAFTLLRVHSQSTGQPLFERADDIVASSRRPGREIGLAPLGEHHD